MSWNDWAAIFGWLLLVVEVGLRLFALGVIPGNRKPSTGSAWLLLILIEPILGFGIYLMFGRTNLGRTRSERQRAAHEQVGERLRPLLRGELDDLPKAIRSVVTLNEELGSLPLTGANRVDLLPDYDGSFAAMAEEVRGATDYVHVQFYITAWDDRTDVLFRELVAASERGVAVRLLFDHVGSKRLPGYKQMLDRLRASKIEWYPMLPIQPFKRRWRRPDLRNHRKMVVVDRRVGFTGSQNLTEPSYNNPKYQQIGREWVELMVRLEGPVVAALDAVFDSDWYTETGAVPEIDAPVPEPVPGGARCQVVPSGPGFAAENNLRMFTTLIYSATERISLTSPYFVPDESLLYAVTTAAQRGIEIELFVSEVSDQFMVGHAQASYYRQLLEAGVRIYRYPAPYILHSKHFTIDHDVAVIGSSNMDMRSFALNYEVSLLMLGSDVVARMREVEDAYRAISPELTLEEWQGRSPGKKYVDNVMRLTAALQ